MPPSQCAGNVRWRSAFLLWFWNFTFLGCVHLEEKFRPGFILPAQIKCVVQEPNQVAVGIQVILLCGFNQTVDHSAGLSASWGVEKSQFFRPITKGFMLRSAQSPGTASGAGRHTPVSARCPRPAGSSWPWSAEIASAPAAETPAPGGTAASA